ncbi:hypothetical protein [Streptomyces radicis]|uniref:DUF8175 domain-containing protein n=1 Tax=Streptomyces radicis TaxID=1750517 RepID=A0A3A9VXC0_9ACTN|nr:hypothetical protein [Streptomyces radicis]RKN05571.1 hypothetical protein D7319_25195 [Streptomyces radicis]RKN17440.1 hypothetical protein D7318_24560 [Streptomyces radicis]
MSYGDDYDDTRTGRVPSPTRTRLPEQDEPPSRRPAASPGRSILTVVAVIVVLLAAIVFANQSREDGSSGDDGGDREDARPTAPTGERPVDGAFNGIPTGHAQTEQGAQSAAANYAVALGGVEMFNEARRRTIVDSISASATRDDLRASYDSGYSAQLNEDIGLDPEGVAPTGMTFVNRTMPVGSSTVEYGETAAEVSVWCTGLFGMAGAESRNPVRTSWFTITFDLVWEDGDWKVSDTEQAEGPTPVGGDDRVSGADEIAEAVEQYGGFTYAR